MSKPGEVGGSGTPPPIGKKPLSSSSKAVQKPSQKDRLITSHLQQGGYKFHTIPIIGGLLKAIFGSYYAKKQALSELKKKLAKSLRDYSTDPKSLAKKTFAELELEKKHGLAYFTVIDQLLDAGGGPFFLYKNPMESVVLFNKIPSESREAFEKILALICITTPRSNLLDKLTEWLKDAAKLPSSEFKERVNNVVELYTAQLKNAFSGKVPGDVFAVHPAKQHSLIQVMLLRDQIGQMFGKRFTESDKNKYIDEWIKVAKNEDLTPQEFNKLADQFLSFVREAVRIQNDRPAVLTTSQVTSLTPGDMVQSFAIVNSQFLSKIVSAIQDSSLVVNVQAIQESLISMIREPTYQYPRSVPNLTSRSDTDYSLSREFHPEFTIYEDGEDKVDFTGKGLTISITDEKTGETRTVRIPLPFSGEISKTQARKLIRVLHETIDTDTKFDHAYDQEQLPPKQKEQIKKAFLEWKRQAGTEYGKVLFDFNETNSRPQFSFAYEKSEIELALKEPNEVNALEVAKGENLFLLNDGKTLSLLPPEISSQFEVIGQISSNLVEESQAALLNQSQAPLKIDLPGGEGELTLKQTPQELEGRKIIWIEMTIEQGGNFYTRKALYEGDSIEVYAKSSRLQRDLLLTKGEFYERTALASALKKNPEGVRRALATYPQCVHLMGSRLASGDRVAFQNQWIRAANEMEAEEFNQALDQFEQLLREAQRIQAQRPKVYSDQEQANLLLLSSQCQGLFDQYPLLKQMAREIKNGTTPTEHPISSNIKLLHADSEQMRGSSALQRLDTGNSLSLSREINPKGFERSTNFYITNEKTLETRCIRLPLPIQDEEMLPHLEKAVENPGYIDKMELPQQTKEKFKAFSRQLNEEMGRCVFDFNTTPPFRFAKEDMAQAIKNPRSMPLLIQAAKKGSLFLLKDGSLSLLPQECANPLVGQIDKRELQEISQAVLKNESTRLSLPNKNGEIGFASSKIEVRGEKFLRLETKIVQGEKEHTRISLYRLGEKTVEEKRKELAGSRRLQRDVLLAKSEFMHAHL